VKRVENIFLKKMIRNCFVQYQHDFESVPLSEQDYKELIEEVELVMKEDPEADVFEVVNDAVYEYLSKW
jgi:hypothetical protein